MAENIIDTLASPKTAENPALRQKREAMRQNTELYNVQSGDTIAQIAQKHGITDHKDLLALNRLMGNNLEVSGKNETRVLIRPFKEGENGKNYGTQIYIPKDMEKFQSDIAGVKKISEAIMKNEKIARGDRSVLKNEINERIFPRFRQSLGMHRLNEGLLGNMQASLHLPGPRQVDPKFEKDASCAHYYRQDIRSAFNIGDMPKSWKKFMNKSNIDAWQLPVELLGLKSDDGKDEFVQKANFMDFFDKSKFGAKTSPVLAGKEQEYARAMVELNTYLEKNPNATNTAIPVYYRYSNYQLRGISEAKNGKEAHYNTHMMRYVGSKPTVFSAHEWGEVRPDGSVTSFGGDKKRLEKEVSNLKGMLASEKSVYEERKSKLMEYSATEFSKHTFTIDKKLTEYSKGAKTEAARTALKKEMESLFDSGNIDSVRTGLTKIIRWPVTEEDAKLLIHWQKNKRKVVEGIKEIDAILKDAKPAEYPYFSPEDYGAILTGSKRVFEVLTSYNASAKRVNELEKQIVSTKDKMENLEKEEQNREKTRKEAQEQIAKITPELEKAKTEHERVKQAFLESMDESKNPELKAWFDGFDAVARKHFGPSGASRADALIQGFRSGKLGDDFRVQMKMTEADFSYLKALFQKREKTRKDIGSLRSKLGVRSDTLPEIRIEGIDKIFGTNNQLVQALSAYNKSASKVNGYQSDIYDREEKMKIKKEIPATEYLLNFLQQRADYSASAMQSAGRKQILEGLTMYAGAVQMKVNGKAIDIAAELKKPKKDQSPVSPDDTIELGGPVMTDGFHIMTLKDPVELHKMQGRQRYFFELLATQTFFPSETIEPTAGSLMHRTKFREATDKVKTRGNYSLNRGDTIEHAIKRLIPIHERAEFDKLDPASPNYEQEYKKLIQKHYGLQVKGLQMLGYMQSEDILNPGAVKINQGMPYFDSADTSKNYSDYIGTVKSRKMAENKEVAPYIEYMDVQLLPGDTYGNIFGRIVAQLENYKNHADAFPNLQYLGGFNDFLKKEFLRQYVESSIKSNANITWQDMLEGKVKPGAKFILHLARMDRIIKDLRGISYTPDISKTLKKVDSDVIGLMVPTQQNRNLIQSTMYVESYEYDNGKWYVPDGASRFVKRKIEEYPALRNIKHIQSYGDFQVRGILDLRSGFGSEWITKAQLEQTMGAFDRADIEKYISAAPESQKAVIESDLAIMKKIRIILSKKDTTPADSSMIVEYLLKLVRLDDGTGSNIVGKIIGVSLLNQKINTHFQKLNGVLEATLDPVRNFSNDSGKMQRYEDGIYLINNMGEKQAIMGFAENFLYRTLEGTKILDKNGAALQYAALTRKNGRSLQYRTSDFLSHVELITDQVATSKQFSGTQAEMNITSRILRFWTNVQQISLDFRAKRREMSEESEKTKDPSEKSKIKKDIDASYIAEDTKILREIYALFSDKEFKGHLSGMDIDTSILPTKEEISARDSFRSNFFNHVRKGDKVEKAAAIGSDTQKG